MRRIRTLALAIAALLLLAVPALAESPDWSSMTDDQLRAAIAAAQSELDSRAPDAAPGEYVLVDAEGVRCYLTGDYTVSDGSLSDYCYLTFAAVVENSSSIPVSVSPISCSVNGWETYGSGIGTTRPGKKQRGEISICLSDCGIHALADVRDIEVVMGITNSSTWFGTWRGDSIHIPVPR